MKKYLIFPYVVLFVLITNVQAASFDCKKAKTFAEKTICEFDSISKLDDEMAIKYKELLSKSGDKIRNDQRAWIKEMNSCADARCINSAYLGRLSEIEMELKNVNKSNTTFSDQKTKKNFLLGLCEIPHKSSLSECSLEAIARMDGTVGVFSIYQEDKLSFTVRSSNKIPANLAINKDFSVSIKYEIDEKSNKITTVVTNTTGNCLTKTNYELKNENTIIVRKGSLSQGCGDYERTMWEMNESAFEMKFRRVK